MNIYKELITHEVFPALGCTEPTAVACAAALAAAQLQGEVEEVRIEVDLGVFKNGVQERCFLQPAFLLTFA